MLHRVCCQSSASPVARLTSVLASCLSGVADLKSIPLAKSVLTISQFYNFASSSQALSMAVLVCQRRLFLQTCFVWQSMLPDCDLRPCFWLSVNACMCLGLQNLQAQDCRLALACMHHASSTHSLCLHHHNAHPNKSS